MVSPILLITIAGAVLLYLMSTDNNIINSIPFIGKPTPKDNISISVNQSNTTQPQNSGIINTIITETTKQILVPIWIIVLILLIIVFKR